jgi:hypothetical protein
MQEKDDGGRTQREKSIDEWLPINSSRKAKWWYSAFHNVTAMVGAGVLGLPYAMSELGWYVRTQIEIRLPRFSFNPRPTYQTISSICCLIIYWMLI